MTRIIILTCLVQVLSVVCPGAFAEPSPPNFVIIFCDNLGYGDIEPFGSTLHRTPHLNRMANEGILFTRMYTEVGCTPSRAACMTGRHPIRNAMYNIGMLREMHGLRATEVTLAEVLGDSARPSPVGGGRSES